MLPTDAAALGQWADFPVTSTPRPLVLLAGYVQAPAGFVDSAAKQAFLAGAIEASVDVPPGVLRLLRGSNREHSEGLVVRAVRLSSAAFMTDRGPREMPAYELDIPGAVQPVRVLDPTTQVWWPAEPAAEISTALGPATIEADERTLHVLTGGSVLTEFLRCEFVESRAAVLARPVTAQRPVAPGTAIPAMMVVRSVSGRLTEPLGARVLINTAGEPIAVLPAA